jgi:T5SS/PEP-CTERM-associated repeat protein/autotransporter-associated beta strand protein
MLLSTRFQLTLCCLVAMYLLFPASSYGATTWSGSEGGNWSVDANWTQHEPTAASDVTLENGNTAIISQNNAACSMLYLGQTSGRTGKLNVQSGGLLNCGGMEVGVNGLGSVTIGGGGQISSSYAYLGYNSTGSGTVTVDGPGATWNNSGLLEVGYLGHGTLSIKNGGHVSNTLAEIRTFGGLSCNIAVSGSNSRWDNSSYLHLGGGNGSVSLTIDGGAQVSSDSGSIAYAVGSPTVVSVDGAGSSWTNSSSLEIGRSTTGTLSITNGGQVSSANAYAGYGGFGDGKIVVSGSDSNGNRSKWTSSNVYLGGDSTRAIGQGRLEVTNGGQADVSGSLKLWKATSTVTVNQGRLSVGTLEGTAGSISIVDPVGGTALTIGSSASSTFSGGIGGSGSLSKIGDGIATLSGANSYLGITTISAGELVLAGSNAWNPITNLGGAYLSGGKLLFDYTGSEDPYSTILGLLGTDITGYMPLSIVDDTAHNRIIVSTVPEPSAVVLLAIGAIGLLGFTWRRRKHEA